MCSATMRMGSPTHWTHLKVWYSSLMARLREVDQATTQVLRPSNRRRSQGCGVERKRLLW